jgi:hypothetical protein
MKGRRVHPDGRGELPQLEPGDYCKGVDGSWVVCCPAVVAPGEFRIYGQLRKHKVTEHEDGTITVSPSIVAKNRDREWHGFLEKGIWREA